MVQGGDRGVVEALIDVEPAQGAGRQCRRRDRAGAAGAARDVVLGEGSGDLPGGAAQLLGGVGDGELLVEVELAEPVGRQRNWGRWGWAGGGPAGRAQRDAGGEQDGADPAGPAAQLGGGLGQGAVLVGVELPGLGGVGVWSAWSAALTDFNAGGP